MVDKRAFREHFSVFEVLPPRRYQLYRPGRCLRSGDQLLLAVPNTSPATYGHRTFSAAALAVWNALPIEIHQISLHATFCSSLKTHYFRWAFRASPVELDVENVESAPYKYIVIIIIIMRLNIFSNSSNTIKQKKRPIID